MSEAKPANLGEDSPVPEDPQTLRETAQDARRYGLNDLADGLERVADKLEERENDE